MTEVVLVLGVPLIGAFLQALWGHRPFAAGVNAVTSLLTFLASAALTVRVVSLGPLTVMHELFFVDAFNVFLGALTAFVGFTTAIFSRVYMRIEQDRGKLSAGQLRLYHSMYQLFTFTMLLALLTNNVGILWVAMEAATLATVLLVSLYRTPAGIEAAWKYFILASVGISLAFFGTILIYLAGQPILGEGLPSMTWSLLQAAAVRMDPAILDLAFIFLLIGCGTKVGLAPLHAWLPDAHAEGPTPISAVLSGLLLNVALYAVLRPAHIVLAFLLFATFLAPSSTRFTHSLGTLTGPSSVLSSAFPHPGQNWNRTVSAGSFLSTRPSGTPARSVVSMTRAWNSRTSLTLG
jgi:hydrogenase-4 component F